MDFEQFQQEAENLKQVDVTKLSPEQLEKLVEKLSRMLDINESFIEDTKSQIEELNIEEDESNDDQ
jgi:hypothetical protein